MRLEKNAQKFATAQNLAHKFAVNTIPTLQPSPLIIHKPWTSNIENEADSPSKKNADWASFARFCQTNALLMVLHTIYKTRTENKIILPKKEFHTLNPKRTVEMLFKIKRSFLVAKCVLLAQNRWE